MSGKRRMTARERAVQRTARLARAIEDCAARLRASWGLDSGDAEHEVTIDVESALRTLAERVRAGDV